MDQRNATPPGDLLHTTGGLPLRLSWAPGPRRAPPGCAALLAEAEAELIRTGRPPETEPPAPVLFAWYYGEPVGAIQYRLRSDRHDASISLAWVRPTVRGRGVYRALCTELRRIAKSQYLDTKRVSVVE